MVPSASVKSAGWRIDEKAHKPKFYLYLVPIEHGIVLGV